MKESVYICPDCWHEFVQGEYNYNYDAGHLDFECPDCGWEGNVNIVYYEDE